MRIKEIDISCVNDLIHFRSAPQLNKSQFKKLYNELENIIFKTDWLTIGIMAPSLKIGMEKIRKIEKVFKLEKMKSVLQESDSGPIFIKANQKTGEIHSRVEHGLGEGILISCHDYDNTIDARTLGPFPLNFFD